MDGLIYAYSSHSYWVMSPNNFDVSVPSQVFHLAAIGNAGNYYININDGIRTVLNSS